MLPFIARRLLCLVFVLFSLTFITFMVGHLAPGDPIQSMMGNRHDPQRYAELRRAYGFDRPLLAQYISYVDGLLHGNLGKSFQYPDRPVGDILKQGVPVSFKLGFAALVLSTLVGVPAGVIAALHHNRISDRMIMIGVLALFSIPSFVLIPILQEIDYGAYSLGWPSLPVAGWGQPQNWVMPVLVLAAASTGYIARLTRASVLEALRQDYVRTAWAKGLAAPAVHTRHVLRNALLPVVTVLGPSTAFLVTGAFIVESLFSIPGIGFLAIQSIGQRDYPVIQATTLLLGLAVVVLNLITDILYAVLDPRIRLQ